MIRTAPMAPQGVERRLAVILAADVAGYSRLMEADEEATLRTLNAYRQMIDDFVSEHRGRVFGSAGDSVIAEFASPVEAVRCAVEIQRDLALRNADLAEDRRMRFRIGINLGDVMAEGDNLLGDGVNVAARLEGLAEPGGICISGKVWDEVGNKLELGFEDLGEHVVKNIAKPVPVYRVHAHPGTVPRMSGAARRQWRNAAMAALTVIAVALGGVAIWILYSRPSSPPIELASDQGPTLELPDKPSIAVLPFDNLSDDPDQDYFADGMTEDLITDLSKVSGLFVIARNSTFAYKGKQADVRDVARELGVKYILEGSVRRDGDLVRINAQLVDAVTGGHLWAERYDGGFGDVFALQDRITSKVVAALQVALTQSERDLLARSGTKSAEAYDHFLRGFEFSMRFTREYNEQAQREYDKAIEIDPNYARPHALLGWTHWMASVFAWSASPQESFGLARDLADKAVALDDSLPTAHWLLGKLYLWSGRHDEAVAQLERALPLDPNAAHGFGHYGDILVWSGRPEDALPWLEKALRLSPNDQGWILTLIGFANYLMGRYEIALASLDRALVRNPGYLWAHIMSAAVHGELGQAEQGRASVTEILRLNPNLSLSFFKQTAPFKVPGHRERMTRALRSAGLPE